MIFRTIFNGYRSLRTELKNIYLRYKYVKCGNIHPTLQFGQYSKIQFGSPSAKLYAGENVNIRKYCSILVDGSGVLRLGKNVFFNNYCAVTCHGEIEIGENTLFGEGVKMYDHNHLYNNEGGTLNVDRRQMTVGKIKIGKNCWIASNVTILKDVEIGDNVIVGAGCLVYKSIPSNAIVKSNQSTTIKVV